MHGWIKLHRKCLDSGILQNRKLWTFWTWCLLKATHKEHTQVVGYQKVKLMPGQFIFGRKKASEELGMSEQMIRTALNSLKKSESLTIKTTNKYSVITIVNWDTYQVDQPTTNQQDNKQLTNNQPTTNHKQEGEEVKEDKKKDTPPAPPKKPKKKIKPHEEAVKVATWMADHILSLDENCYTLVNGKKSGAIERWAIEIDRINRIGKRDWPVIWAVVKWAREDPFWQPNIKSGKKLKEKFDTLLSQATAKGGFRYTPPEKQLTEAQKLDMRKKECDTCEVMKYEGSCDSREISLGLKCKRRYPLPEFLEVDIYDERKPKDTQKMTPRQTFMHELGEGYRALDRGEDPYGES